MRGTRCGGEYSGLGKTAAMHATALVSSSMEVMAQLGYSGTWIACDWM